MRRGAGDCHSFWHLDRDLDPHHNGTSRYTAGKLTNWPTGGKEPCAPSVQYLQVRLTTASTMALAQVLESYWRANKWVLKRIRSQLVAACETVRLRVEALGRVAKWSGQIEIRKSSARSLPLWNSTLRTNFRGCFATWLIKLNSKVIVACALSVLAIYFKLARAFIAASTQSDHD